MPGVFVKPWIRFILFLLVGPILLLVTSVCHAAPRAVGGVLDLSHWHFPKDGTTRLDGEWEFYGNVLIPADAFHSPHTPHKPELIKVPGSWDTYLDHSGNPMGPDGFATYRLRILLPDQNDNASQSPWNEFAIFIPYVNTNYQLWVNGELLAANGTVGRTRDEAKPLFIPKIAHFRPEGPNVDVVLHVSNFHFREGGIPRRLEFGTADQISLKQRRNEVLGATLWGATLIMAIFFAGIYAVRRESRADAFFSLFLLTIALRMSVTGYFILSRVMLELPWELVLKVEYLTAFLSPTLFLYYLRALFPEDVSTFVVRSWSAVVSAACVAILVLPGRLSSHIIPLYVLLLAPLLIYSVYVGVRAVAHGRPDSRLFLGGIVGAITASLITLMRYLGFVDVTDLVPAGIIVLILSQSLILALRTARTYRRTVVLAAENARMLEQTEWQLEKLKEYRRLMTLREENLRRHIAETLHGRTQGRLFAAVRRIDEADREMDKDVAEAREYLADAKALVDQVREDDIRNLGRQLHPAAVGAGIVAAVEALLDAFDESYHVVFDVDPDVEAMDEGKNGGFDYDLRLGVYRIVEEGLNNISRHAKAQSIRLSLSLKEKDGENYLELTLTDDGVGLNPQAPSGGLGLATIDARVGDLGGEWEITDARGGGTTLRVIIPLVSNGSIPERSVPDRLPPDPTVPDPEPSVPDLDSAPNAS